MFKGTKATVHTIKSANVSPTPADFMLHATHLARWPNAPTDTVLKAPRYHYPFQIYCANQVRSTCCCTFTLRVVLLTTWIKSVVPHLSRPKYRDSAGFHTISYAVTKAGGVLQQGVSRIIKHSRTNCGMLSCVVPCVA